jgi:hypothetical protein
VLHIWLAVLNLINVFFNCVNFAGGELSVIVLSLVCKFLIWKQNTVFYACVMKTSRQLTLQMKLLQFSMSNMLVVVANKDAIFGLHSVLRNGAQCTWYS